MATIRSRGRLSYFDGVPAKDPVILFDVDGLELECGAVLAELLPTFCGLEWDLYDVRREQGDIIRRTLGGNGNKDLDAVLLDYYRGEISLDDLRNCIHDLPENANNSILAVRPYRQRTTAILHVLKDGKDWRIERKQKRPIAQDVPPSDYRSVERKFPESSSALLEHPHYTALISKIAELVAEVQSNVRQLEFVSWQTSITATKDRTGSNSPEGIHQDGSDYIVSALVLERDNVAGGESRIFAPDKSTQHFGVTLQPGQGILQADKGSNLWHDVTPISIADTSKGNGTRKILGFDINVIATT